jgi:hypothetical protein
MVPEKLLYGKFRIARNDNDDMLGGIGPERLLLERSRDES